MIHWAPERGIDKVFGELQGQIMTFQKWLWGGGTLRISERAIGASKQEGLRMVKVWLSFSEGSRLDLQTIR